MQLPPHLQQLLADEHTRRGLAWLALEPDLCGCPVVSLTPRIYYELHLAGSAFLAAAPATRADVFAFLWRLHPNFRRPDGSMPNRASGHGSLLLALLARRWLARRVRAVAVWPAEVAIRERLHATRQDALTSCSEPSPSALPRPVPHLLDGWCHWWGRHYGCDPRAALDVPVAVILQCRRAEAIASGEPVIDPSAQAIGAWLFAQHPRRQAVAAGRN